MTYEETRKALEKLINGNYANFVRALVSLEKDIKDKNILDKAYDAYMEDDGMLLLNYRFDFVLSEISND